MREGGVGEKGIAGSVKVLLIDDTQARARVLREALKEAGYEVVQAAAAPLALMKAVERAQPDVIIIDVDSPSRDVLEHIVVMSQNAPRPIVMFASDGAEDKIREAVKAGVSAYVVDGLEAARVKPIIDVAVKNAPIAACAGRMPTRLKGMATMMTMGVGKDWNHPTTST